MMITKDNLFALSDLWEHLAHAEKPIVLYGMGDGADKIINELESRNITVSGVFASDDFVRGQIFRGFTVKKYSDLLSCFGDMIVLISFGTHLPEIINRIKKIESEVETYVPDVAVFGTGLFDKSYALNHYDEIKTVYNMLSDELSQKTFIDLIKYKITGKAEYLYSCETDDEPLLFSNSETYLDLGAYTGDTAEQFSRKTDGKYERIICVEPDIKTFKKLLKNTEKYKNLQCLNICIGKSEGTSLFAMKSGRNSAVSEIGKEIEMNSVDNILQGKPVTFIKADVEGQESNAIIGAEKSIIKYKPKLKIAEYHRFNDIISIPLQVMKIRSDYKLYLRHKPHIPAWDTDFYFI